MKKLLALLLCSAMLVTLCFTMSACDDRNPDYEKSKDSNSSTVSDVSSTESTQSTVTMTDEEMIVGTWKGKMALEQGFVEELLGSASEESAEAEAFLKYFDIDQLLDIKFTVVFNENGTYTMSVAEEDLENYVDDTVDVMCDGMINLMKDFAKENGKTWEAFLAESNLTEEQFKDVVLEQLDKQELIDSIKEEMELEEGYYKFSNGKFYTSENKNFEGDDVDISDYELTEATFKMIAEEKASITFTKVK